MKPNCFDPCSWQLKYCLSRDAGNPRPRSACIQPQLAERTATVMVSRGTDSLITGLGILAIESYPLRHARSPATAPLSAERNEMTPMALIASLAASRVNHPPQPDEGE